MNQPLRNPVAPQCRRKEKRFKTSDDHRLTCRTSVDEPGQDQVWEGTTVDISSSGIRLLTDGHFAVGQPIWTELRTTRSHGIYRGNIRRIEPWVGGRLILGCSLRDTIPREVLQELAGEGIINRRSDGRFSISQPAFVSWPLAPEEVEVEIQDYSSGGMKVMSTDPIPEDARLRLRFETGGEEVMVEAKRVWTRPTGHHWISGIAFSDPDATKVVVETLGQPAVTDPPSDATPLSQRSRQALTVVAFLALFGCVWLAIRGGT